MTVNITKTKVIIMKKLFSISRKEEIKRKSKKNNLFIRKKL